MAERPIDLGNQRLSVSQALGDEFVSLLEGPPRESDPETVKLSREFLAENGKNQIIGVRFEEEASLSGFKASLCQQMGLPEGSSLRDVRDRLAGRESHFLLVVLGMDNLSQKDGIKLSRQIKRLNLKNVAN